MASKIYRNPKIGRWIREQMFCFITGQPNPVNHHIIGNGFSGIGTKAPDWAQMPLCHRLHMELHDNGWRSFESKYGVTQKEMISETLQELCLIGLVDIDELGKLPEWALGEENDL